MRAARFLSVFLLGLMISLNVFGQAQDKNAVAAQKAEEAWLGLVDSGKYAESYKVAGATFQAAVSEEKWVEAVQAARSPLGKLESRTLKNVAYTKTLSGAPSGEYEVLTFEAR